jgi:hypothetical protein
VPVIALSLLVSGELHEDRDNEPWWFTYVFHYDLTQLAVSHLKKVQVVVQCAGSLSALRAACMVNHNWNINWPTGIFMARSYRLKLICVTVLMLTHTCILMVVKHSCLSSLDQRKCLFSVPCS